MSIQHVRRSIFHVWLPGLVTLVFGLRAMAFICFPNWFDTPAKRLAIFSEFLPQNGRRSFETTVLFWSLMHVLYVVYIMHGRLGQWSVLAIFKVHPEGTIKPTNLDLRIEEYRQVAKFRTFAANVCDFICYGISFGASLAVGFQGVVINSVLKINVANTIFWWSYLSIWVFYVCSAAYGLPIFIMVIARYIQIKQTTVVSDMERVNQKHKQAHQVRDNTVNQRRVRIFNLFWSQRNRVIELHRRYATIQHELSNYSGLVTRCLNIIFLVFIVILCYITYLLFFTEAAFEFKILYSQVYSAHIIVLTLLIVRCSAITRFNRRLRLHVIRFYIHGAMKRLYGARDLLMFDQISQNLRYKTGFSLVNGFRIDTKAYFAVIYAISIFFFLIMKRQKILE